MFFTKNTLSEIDTVRAVTAVALISLKRYFEGSSLLSAAERNKFGSVTIASLGAQASIYHQAKLMAFVDKLTTTVVNTPTFHTYFRNSILDASEETIDEARQELSLLAFNGLLQNKIIHGSSKDYWNGSNRINDLVEEFNYFESKAVEESSEVNEKHVGKQELVQTAVNVLCGLMELQLALLSESTEVAQHKFTIGYLSGITKGYIKYKGLEPGGEEERVVFESCVVRLFGEENLHAYCEQIYEKSRKLKDVKNGLRIGEDEINEFLKNQKSVIELAGFFHDKDELQDEENEKETTIKNQELTPNNSLTKANENIKNENEPEIASENRFWKYTSLCVVALYIFFSLSEMYTQIISLFGGQTSVNFEVFSGLPDATNSVYVLYALCFEAALRFSVAIFVLLSSFSVLLRFNRAVYTFILITSCAPFIGFITQSGLNLALNRDIFYNYHLHSKSLTFFVFWVLIIFVMFMAGRERKYNAERFSIAPIKCSISFFATLVTIFFLILFSGVISPLLA